MEKNFRKINQGVQTAKGPYAIRTVTKHPSKMAYLTFDDGPCPATKTILDTLSRYHASGTFFVLEPNIRRFPWIVRRAVREGHAMGLHGVTHKVERFYASKESVLKEVNQTRRTLRQIVGKNTVLVRTPYGSTPHLKPAFAKAIRTAGYRLWDWNVDSLDWKFRDERSVRNVIRQVQRLERYKVRPVILMHDLPETARFLPKIIEYLKRRGYVLKRLDSSLKPIQFVK